MFFNGRICAVSTFAVAVCVGILTASVQPSAASPAAASTPGPTASSAQIDQLVADINAHKQLCDKVTSKQAGLFKQCSNEQVSLVARQKQLGVSDKDLNSKLQTRGWRWP